MLIFKVFYILLLFTFISTALAKADESQDPSQQRIRVINQEMNKIVENIQSYKMASQSVIPQSVTTQSVMTQTVTSPSIAPQNKTSQTITPSTETTQDITDHEIMDQDWESRY